MSPTLPRCSHVPMRCALKMPETLLKTSHHISVITWLCFDTARTLETGRARRSCRRFTFVLGICNSIGSGRDRARRLDQLLDMTSSQSGPTSSPLSKLTSLYDRILETAFPLEEGCLADFHYVVGSIIVLETPLP